MEDIKHYKELKYCITTFGCQANIADSSMMAGILEALGFEKTEDFTESNVFIINTCSVRQKSEDKVYGIAKKLKGLVKKPFVIMAGCMVGSVTGERQRYEFEELQKRTPWVDEYINPTQLRNIPNILMNRGLIGEWAMQKFSSTDVNQVYKTKEIGYVNISYGCDNFCTFCVVPYARGGEVSRSEREILREVKHLLATGFKHIMLCGQNVNSWGIGMNEKFKIRTGSEQNLPFANLLRTVHDMEGLEKLSFLSSNPFDFTQDLIDAIKLPKIDNFLHIAVQSGNDEILKKMNRRHSINDFLNLIEKIKKEKPNVEFGTDVIVGFPSETREQFMDTVKLFETVPFNVAFISIYSPRKGTPAERFYKDDVPLAEKKWRHKHLNDVWKRNRPVGGSRVRV